MGSVFSETYNIDKDLIKDTKIYQNDSFSVYEISSEIQGTARIGQRVQKNAKTVPSFIMGGTYMGYAQIRSETIAGKYLSFDLTLPVKRLPSDHGRSREPMRPLLASLPWPGE